MAKVNITYNAPEGDSPHVIHGGRRFFDGIPIELDSELDSEMIERLRGNQHFEVENEAPAAQSNNGNWS